MFRVQDLAPRAVRHEGVRAGCKGMRAGVRVWGQGVRVPGQGVRVQGHKGMRAVLTSFSFPTASQSKKFKQVPLWHVVLRCSHHLQVQSPPHLYSQSPKRLSLVPTTCPKFRGKNRQSATKVTLMSHQKCGAEIEVTSTSCINYPSNIDLHRDRQGVLLWSVSVERIKFLRTIQSWQDWRQGVLRKKFQHAKMEHWTNDLWYMSPMIYLLSHWCRS